MKIIKKGQKPNEHLEGKCRRCGCMIECTSHEATWMEDRPGDPTACYAVACPTCGGWIYLKEMNDYE